MKSMLHKFTSTMIFLSSVFTYLNAGMVPAGFDRPEYSSLQGIVSGNILNMFL